MNNKQIAKQSKTENGVIPDELLELEARYCSWGDTVHYAEKPNIFTRSEEFIYMTVKALNI